jgi:hypothetical protein
MSIIKGYPHAYEMPRLGQVFQREQQDGRWEYGHITGLKVTNVQLAPDEGGERIAGWMAHLTNGWVQFREIIRSGATYTSTEDWHPVPAEKQDEVRQILAARLEEAFEKLGVLAVRVTTLEDALKKTDAPRPSRSASA